MSPEWSKACTLNAEPPGRAMAPLGPICTVSGSWDSVAKFRRKAVLPFASSEAGSDVLGGAETGGWPSASISGA